jgi:hypothetical protein
MVAPRRRRSRLLPPIAAAAVLVTGIAACSDDDTTAEVEPAGEVELIPAESTVVDDPPDSTDPAPETGPDGEPDAGTTDPVGAPDPAAAATTLYDAAVADDRATAATVAEPDAVDAAFAVEPGPYALYSACDSGEFDISGCLFRDRTTDDTIQFDMERRDGGWVVVNVFASAG